LRSGLDAFVAGRQPEHGQRPGQRDALLARFDGCRVRPLSWCVLSMTGSVAGHDVVELVEHIDGSGGCEQHDGFMVRRSYTSVTDDQSRSR
jgi:hypothetical protein